jgi:RNA polymerase sigma-54 factor
MMPKLELRQGQTLVMTPQLQQAIKLLQMSNADLQAFVDSELERNPLIERDEGGPAPRQDSGTSSPAALAGEPAPRSREAGAERGSALNEGDPGAVAGAPDSGWTTHVPGSSGSLGRNNVGGVETAIACETSLHDHLTLQLNLALSEPADRLIGAYLAGMVDERGYLGGDIDMVAEQLGAATADVERVLAIMQDFDPPGVMARDLKECLVLQLKERGRYDPAMAVFVEHLDLVARRDYAALGTLCGVDLEDIREMARETRSLNPRPGNGFGSAVIQPIVPDVLVKPAPDGAWLVELNSDVLPRLLVSRQYYAKVIGGAAPEADKTFVSDCLSSANWLVKSLDQRARTILKVAREIVRQQDGFLIEGIAALRPLNLRIVADAIGMHESTVSRVTANKYMATPRGVFAFKYFFTSAVQAADGEAVHSSASVRQRIRELVAAEAPQAVLSDDAIVEALREAGIAIARRTVAKYRDAMGIASSVQRRRDKNQRA